MTVRPTGRPPPRSEAGAEVISYKQNQGKGMAIQIGLRAMLKKGVEYVILLDADGQHLPEEIPRFLEAVTRDGSKLLVGNRMHDTRKTMPLAAPLDQPVHVLADQPACAGSRWRTPNAAFA